MSSEKISLEGLRIDRSAIPQTQRPVWLIPLILILLAIAGLTFWILQKPKAAVVKTIIVQEQVSGASGQKTLLNASGYVTARRAATVSSKVTGKVVEVFVEEGMKVEEGQVLAKLDSSNVLESLQLAEAQLEAAKKTMDETRPNLVFAQQEMKRFADLAASKATSQSDYHRAEAAAKSLEATLARQNAEITVAERQVSTWKQQVDDNIIRAPFKGIVTVKNAQPGEMISPMSSGGFTRTGICTIVDMNSLEIDVDVNESYINRVQAGLPVEATLDAYAGWKIPAKVIAIIPTADRQKATVKVRVGFEKLDPRILPDMGVKVAFQSGEPDKTQPATRSISIPKAAVQKIDNRDIIWVVKDGVVERRAVTVGQTTGDEMSIIAGLNRGENVIIQTSQSLKEGSHVTESK